MTSTDPAQVHARVLVVEDDPAVGAGLVAVVASAGHDAGWAVTAAAAVERCARDTPDLVLLDLGLPDADGLEVCRTLRAAHPLLVVVVVTARTDESDAVQALDAGADDYVPKPVRPVELLARLRAHLRRREEAGPPELRVGPLRLDVPGRRAWVRDQELPLRAKEHELLTLLVENSGEAVRRERIMAEVWDEHWHGSTKTLDVHIANLRRKLADAGDRWDRITTLRGYGYRLDADVT